MRAMPKGWQFSSIADLFERDGGFVSDGDWIESKDQDPNGNVRLIQLADVGEGIFLNKSSRFLTDKRAQELRCCFLRQGDILVARMPDPIGRACIFPGDNKPSITAVDVCILRPPKSVNAKWLVATINSRWVRQRVEQQISGTTRQRISRSGLCEIEFLLPPLDEQIEIAAALDNWDVAVKTVEGILTTKFDLKRGLMQQLLTGKIRFKNFKNDSWRTVKIGALLAECDRYMTWSDDTAYRFASIRRRCGGLFDRGTFYGREVKTKVLKSLKAGDFVISKRQVTHGAWAMVTKPFEGFGVSDEYDVLVNRDAKTLDMRFFNYLSQTRRLWHMAYLASNGVHIEKLIFDFDDFAKEKLKIPPTVEEQAMIVDVLSACDAEIKLLKKQLSALKDQKRGLMQKLLTGEVRVKCRNTETLKS